MKPRSLPLVLLVLVGLALGAWFLLPRNPGEGGRRPLEPGGAALEPRGPAAEPAAVEPSAPRVAERSPLAGDADGPDDSLGRASEREAQPVVPVRRVRGSVLGLMGEPVAGVPIALERAPEHVLARSRPDGGFELELQPLPTAGWKAACTLVPDARWAQVQKSCVGEEERPLVVVVAPAIDLDGRVVDGSGTPLADVDLRFEKGPELFTGFPGVLDGTFFEGPPAARSGADGRFALRAWPAGPSFVIAAYLRGYVSVRVPLPESSRADLELVLARDEQAPECLVVGRVLHPDGKPAAGAIVRLGERRTQASVDGSFQLTCELSFDELPLAAWLPGVQPALIEGFGAELRRAQGRPAPVDLVLGPQALALAGRVLDARGEPCAGWQVGLADGTPLSAYRMPPNLLETEVAGVPLPVTTDGQGRFRIAGLAARRYVVRAFDRESLLSLRSEPVEAGRLDLVLQLSEDAVREGLTGSVLSRGGRPLAGVSVGPQIVLDRADFGTTWLSGSLVRTDESGRFALGRVPREELVLSVSGPDVIPENFAVAPHEPDDGHVLRVAARCHFRVEPSGGEPWQAFSVEDADGGSLSIFTFEGGGWGSTSRVELVEGASRTYAVSEDARTLVLLRAGVEPRRVPLALVAGEVLVLRP